MRRFFTVSLGVIAAAIGAAGSASAATTIGETFDPTGGGTCTPAGRTLLQTAPPKYVAPFAGVITSWSYQAAGSPPQLKLKVARWLGGGQFLIVGESSVQTPVPSTLSSYQTQISVKVGDVVGLHLASTGQCFRPNDTSYTWFTLSSDPAPGTYATFSLPQSGVQFDIAARLEADCDNDGLGDETQDTSLSGPACVTGQRAAAIKRCKKKYKGKAKAKKRKKCIKKAKKLPV